jgi:hypothetical protein
MVYDVRVRKFDGIHYKSSGYIYTNKNDAILVKNKHKQEGYKARVIKCKGGYRVFISSISKGFPKLKKR